MVCEEVQHDTLFNHQVGNHSLGVFWHVICILNHNIKTTKQLQAKKEKKGVFGAKGHYLFYCPSLSPKSIHFCLVFLIIHQTL